MGNWNEWTRLARQRRQRRQLSVIICKRLDKHVKNYNIKGIPCHAMPKKPACFLSPCMCLCLYSTWILTWPGARKGLAKLVWNIFNHYCDVWYVVVVYATYKKRIKVFLIKIILIIILHTHISLLHSNILVIVTVTHIYSLSFPG